MFFERYKKNEPSPSTSPSPTSRNEPVPMAFSSSSALEQDDQRASFRDVLPRTALPDQPASLEEIRMASGFPDQPASEQPLACLFYFFHSQMLQHTSTPPDPDLVRRKRQAPDRPVHKLDTHLSRLQMHAGFSEHVKSFAAYPVAVDPTTAALHRGRGGRNRRQPQQPFVTGSYDERHALPSSMSYQPPSGSSNTNPNEERDTVLLMQFRSKASREQWMQSREWREFYGKVNSEEGGIRRMPHVRCARSLKGLMDVSDVLTA